MLDRAARLAAVVEDRAAGAEYRRLADQSRERILAELWREDAGRLGSVGADETWRGHPQIWEEYLAINVGLAIEKNQLLIQLKTRQDWYADILFEMDAKPYKIS